MTCRFAVIADAHFHDTRLDYGNHGFDAGGQRLTMRPLGDVARAPRLYNEAGQALAHALDHVVESGIRHVVLLGDYSDDGQAATLGALQALLARYRQKGLAFYAVPGNHDIYGIHGRHRRKRYLDDDGSLTLVTSDPGFHDAACSRRVVSDAMRCGGYPANLPDDCGFLGVPGGRHFETPFGRDPDPAARQYRLADGRRMMDASYLVEPEPGLWFAMIDANVFVPDAAGDDGLADSTGAGWSALLRHKPFLVDWLADVARRAREGGKTLIAFSHYPVLDPLDATLDDELEMMGRNGFHRRIPSPAVGQALAAAGIALHFSGHVHVNDTARLSGPDGAVLVNVAVPALIAFPAAFKLVMVTGQKVDIETASLDAMTLDPALMAAYGRERALRGVPTGAMLESRDYGAFVSAHLEHVTARRFVKREWPAAVQPLLRMSTLADLLAIGGVEDGDLILAAREIPALSFLADWYRLRMGSDLAFGWIAPERLALYRRLAGLTLPARPAEGEADIVVAGLLKTLARHLGGLPASRVRVDLERGTVEAI